jgi:hypothetical protein
MKKLISFLLLVNLVSCAKVKMDSAKRVDFQNLGEISAISIGDTNEMPLSIVAYFAPALNAINWSSPAFQATDSQKSKLEKISSTVAYNGLEVDKIDQNLRAAIIQKEIYGTIVDELIQKYDVFTCDEITDAADLQKCSDNEIIKNQYQAQEDALQISKSDKIKIIQVALDGKTNNTVNWINFDRIQAKIFLKSKDNSIPAKLEFFANFIPGDSGRLYNSESTAQNNSQADIVEIKQYSKFYSNGINGELVKLDFKILERTAAGDFTGNYYLVSLNMSQVPNLGVRFLGKIKAYTSNGIFIREGKMKFILASK